MVINFFSSFSKKFNSTKAPLIANANKTLTGYLIEPCSIMNPIFEIKRFESDAAPQSYTYAYIGEFARFYFVDDWTWNNGVWRCRLREDVLASFKTQIANSSEYVLRANTTTDYNGAITDMMYPATTDFNIERVVMQNPFVDNISLGTYIVGIINGDNTADEVGAITYYAMTPTEFGALKNKLFSNDNLQIMDIIDSVGDMKITDCSAQLIRTMYNPYQYIASCMWFPVLKSSIPGNQVTVTDGIKIGWWTYPLEGKRISDQTGQFIDGVEQVPVHPQAATRGKYLNYAPYTRITLFGKFGILPIDPAYLEIGSYLRCYYTVDYITGECIYEVYIAPTAQATGQIHIAKTNFMIGVPIQIAQIGVDYLGTAVSAINTVSNALPAMTLGAMTGGPGGAITAGIISGADGVYNTLNSAMPQLQTSGSNGSFAGAEKTTVMVVLQYVIAEENLTHKGRPVCANKLLSTLSGYIKCAEPDIDIACFNEERLTIGRFLVDGFYLE